MSQILTLTLKRLKEIGIEHEIPNITEENAEYLKTLIREKNPKHILEIGTANGYSTLQFASVLFANPESPLSGGEGPGVRSITTIEQAWNMHTFAVENFRNCKMNHIHAIWGDAKAIIPSLADGYFDIVYIDGMKREYLQYFLASIPKMTPDALVIIDDVEKFADKMGDFYEYLRVNTIPYTLEKTDTDDSIMIIERHDIRG